MYGQDHHQDQDGGRGLGGAGSGSHRRSLFDRGTPSLTPSPMRRKKGTPRKRKTRTTTHHHQQRHQPLLLPQPEKTAQVRKLLPFAEDLAKRINSSSGAVEGIPEDFLAKMDVS